MITPKLKDKVLNYLIQKTVNDSFISVDFESLTLELEMREDIITEILHQFERHGLIRKFSLYIGGCVLNVAAGAHDFYLLGGYEGEFRKIELELNKLNAEILLLEKQLAGDNFDKLTKGTGAISALLSTIMTRVGA